MVDLIVHGGSPLLVQISLCHISMDLSDRLSPLSLDLTEIWSEESDIGNVPWLSLYVKSSVLHVLSAHLGVRLVPNEHEWLALVLLHSIVIQSTEHILLVALTLFISSKAFFEERLLVLAKAILRAFHVKVVSLMVVSVEQVPSFLPCLAFRPQLLSPLCDGTLLFLFESWEKFNVVSIDKSIMQAHWRSWLYLRHWHIRL